MSTEQIADAKKRLAAASPSLGQIKVTAPRGSVVRLDDHCPASAPVELFAEEGDHVVSVELRDGKRLTRVDGEIRTTDEFMALGDDVASESYKSQSFAGYKRSASGKRGG